MSAHNLPSAHLNLLALGWVATPRDSAFPWQVSAAIAAEAEAAGVKIRRPSGIAPGDDLQPGYLDEPTPEALLWLARDLARECALSVAWRYEEPPEATEIDPLPPVPPCFGLTEDWWVQVFKACDCYRYQSCEHAGWEDSPARAMTDRLREIAAFMALRSRYDLAAWTVEELPIPARSFLGRKLQGEG